MNVIVHAVICKCNFAIGHNQWSNESLLTTIANKDYCLSIYYNKCIIEHNFSRYDT
jgi:hypothetical protein